MSKIYERYLELKKDCKKKLYLFECGNFYIFIKDDADKINKLFNLKLITFANNVKKCGFPKSALNKYLEMFKKKKLSVQIIQNEKKKIVNNNDIFNIIRAINLDTISPIESFEILKELKDLVH